VSRAKRADANQAALVKFIRVLGASFQHTFQIPGALDGIIGYRGVDVRVEIKDPDQPPSRRALTDAEKKTIDEWRGRKPVIIETEADVVALLKELTR
jgi:hypothetical protein